MIDYSVFWFLIDKLGENWYTLTTNHNLSSATLSRLKKNQHVSAETLEKLCKILECQPGDIVQYVDDNDTEKIAAIKEAMRKRDIDVKGRPKSNHLNRKL